MVLPQYHDQVDLVLDILPIVMEDPRLALKGGTALNLFYFNMPRLSVDIDVCYLPLENRDTSFKNMHTILKRIQLKLEKLGFQVRLSKKFENESEIKLSVRNNKTVVKIEPNYTIRGAVFEAEVRSLKRPVVKAFEKDVTALCLSFADLMGSKICAALDRQHPRDLFDIKYFLDNESFTDQIRKAFIVYLISHPRPMQELLKPHFKDLSALFADEFRGMIANENNMRVTDLIDTRLKLVKAVRKDLTADEREFILSLKKLKPDWELLGVDKAINLPAVEWKIINLKRMSPSKRARQLRILEKILCV